MGLFATFILIGIIFGTLFSLVFEDWDVLWPWLIILTIVGIIVCSVTLMVSWESAVMQKERLATVEQYATRITTYESRAKGDFDDTTSVTDLKYNSFQGQLGEMVTELSGIVIRYNQCQVGKKIYSDNLFFKGLIIYDESIPASIKMRDYIK